MSPRSLFLLAWMVMFTADAVRAAPKLGTVSYQFQDDFSKVAFKSSLIKNDSRENATGALKLQLWACNGPYQGGTIRGHLLATTDRLQNLGPGEAYGELKWNLAYTPPPAAGTYHMVFVLLEYRGDKYVIAESVNMNKQMSLGPLPLFSLEGPWQWQTSIEGGTVDISVGKISHRRKGNTGTLKLSVWLTQAPYAGGVLKGFEIGSVRKDALQPGYVYNDVKNVAKYAPPPAGSYYGNLILSEWREGGYQVVAWIPGTKAVRFDAPKSP